MAVTSYIGEGGDGYTVFKDPQVQTEVDAENTMQTFDLMLKFFESTATSYKPVDDEKAKRQERFELYNTSENDISPDGDWIILNPETDGRITMIE